MFVFQCGWGGEEGVYTHTKTIGKKKKLERKKRGERKKPEGSLNKPDFLSIFSFFCPFPPGILVLFFSGNPNAWMVGREEGE